MSDKKPEAPKAEPTTAAANIPASVSGADPALVKQIADALASSMVPALVAAQLAGQQAQAQAAYAAQPATPSTDVCHVCRQNLKSGCKGDHTEMVVYPSRYPEHARFFPGFIINGVSYLSDNESHTIPVPTVCVSAITNGIRIFEDGERRLEKSQSRSNDSGHISNPKAVKAGEIGWR